jgi:TolA-binding protein
MSSYLTFSCGIATLSVSVQFVTLDERTNLMKGSRLQMWVRTMGVYMTSFILIGGMLVIGGCASSEELSEEELARQQDESHRLREADSLRSVSSSLRAQLSDVEQNNRSLNARVVELERRLQEEMDKAKTSPVLTGGAALEAVTPVSGDVSEAYNGAMKKFKAGKYEEALSAFAGVKEATSGKVKSAAAYWTGECLNGLKRYDDAVKVFEDVIATKGSDKRDDAQYMLAHVYLKMKDTAKAKEAYQTLIDKFPTSEYIARAKDELSRVK